MNEISEKEIFDNFLAESAEIIRDLELGIIALEQNPSDRETVDNIFRYAHSIKGNSSLFGITGIKTLAHAMENLMSRIRDGQMEVDSRIIGIILAGIDHFKSMFSKLIENKREDAITPEQTEYLEEIESVLQSAESGGGNDALRSSLLKFLGRDEVKEELKSNPILDEFLSIIAKSSPDLVADRRQGGKGDQLFCEGLNVSREYYTITGILSDVAAGKLDSSHYSTVASSLEALISKHSEYDQSEPLNLLHALMDDLEMMYQDETGFDEILSGMTQDAMDKYLTMLARETQAAIGSVPAGASELHALEQIRPGKMIKIDQGKLDQTIDLSGEIIVVSEFMNYLQSQFADGKIKTNLNSLKDATTSLQELSEALSRHLYDIRKVPISEAFQNLHRVVRDTAVAVRKKAALVISGEQTPVDKSIVSKLETMLVHIVRNSIDHGLEAPDKRSALGKPEEGKVSISATQHGGTLVITVSDDGRGISIEKLKLALVEKGLATPQSLVGMDDQRVIEHIFLPGFSISNEVTETSGRGVGMDVVLSSAQDMGGGVKLENRAGEGLSTIISIPLTHTTLIKKGLAVAVGHSVFLIPNESVMESFRPSAEEIYTVKGTREMVQRRGEILTLVRLYSLLGATTNVKDPKDGILVLVQNKKNRACFLVDNVIGQRQIIYKNFAIKTVREPSPFEGVSIYDGNKLAMILDIDGIIMQSQNEEW